ncbi:hypothetical protein BB559_007140 [Furculomyces boomerangus]|uniref:Acyl-CoA dehydrogenase n=2 Tax=Harpellales TaxID=61421 RepID=A0A2T9XYN6_9FUNG|nr:hypothetical protein BB559_007140 [Furculomyces boomerangus]PWA02628.1 hypothetical protein BB558_001226 [Smittium angustum]
MFPEISEKEEVIPNEKRFEEELGTTEKQRFGSEHPIVEQLRARARELGLWNLFFSKESKRGYELTNLEYAHVCMVLGKSPFLAPLVTNTNPPDSGNMEVLDYFGTEEQKKKWLVPLMEGKIKSVFSMTEPEVASSNATNIVTSLKEVEGGFIVNGRKWFNGNGNHLKTKLFIVYVHSGNTIKGYNELVKKSTLGERHLQHSVVLVPKDSKGVRVVRPMHVFGFDDAPHGNGEIIFDNVFIPKENVVWELGRGFEIVQARLGPARLHHTMRIAGIAERSLELMIERGLNRIVDGAPLIDKGVIREWVAKSRIEIDTSKLSVYNAAHAVDVKGHVLAKHEISVAKVVVLNSALRVIDRAIQSYGARGVSQDTPLAAFYASVRGLKIADGPDEVHYVQIAKNEIKDTLAKISKRPKL